MVKRHGSQTLAVQVHDHLRTAILNGRYEGGERLLPATLSTDYDVSPTVVREALMRLTEQGLVRLAPNRGFRVVHLTLEDMHDLVEMRLINEVAALRRAIEVGDVTWEGGIVAAHHELSAKDPEVDVDGWFRAHRAFHYSLLSACDNARLLAICSDLLDEGDLYLRWNRRKLRETPALPQGAKRDVREEHRAIMEAALGRDVDLAAAQYQAHLRTTEHVQRALTDPDPNKNEQIS